MSHAPNVPAGPGAHADADPTTEATTEANTEARAEAEADALQRRLLQAFDRHFGGPPQQVVRAPGRVNLIGEHTDYNGGFVLPCAIHFETRVALRARGDGQVRVLALDFGEALDQFALPGLPHTPSPPSTPSTAATPMARLQPNPQLPWAQYVRGVFAELARRGLPLHGVDLAVAGNVPQGAGLSSSAALEVAVALALRERNGLAALDATDLALVAQRAENDFVGCQCGIMDQLVSARGQAGQALLIDCRSLQARPVPVPPGLAVMVVHSRVRRGLVDSHYNLRRQQCQAAAQHLGVAALRDATPAQLQAAQPALDPVVWRRARHIVTENARTLAAAEALRAADLPALGRLMAESHRSMRDDFEITVPAIDQLVAVLQQAIGEQGGARMTGGGFGGCAVALLPEHRVHAVRQAVARGYRSPEGEAATVWITRPAPGAGLCAPGPGA